jgi:hypothetical protein
VPRIRRQNLPRDLWTHLLERVKDRHISVDQLGLLADWLATEPEGPDSRWFKRFSQMIVCGEGELIRTFLQPGQAALGEELK